MIAHNIVSMVKRELIRPYFIIMTQIVELVRVTNVKLFAEWQNKF